MVTVVDKDGFKRHYKEGASVEERSGHLHIYRAEPGEHGLRVEVAGFAPGQWLRWYMGEETTTDS